MYEVFFFCVCVYNETITFAQKTTTLVRNDDILLDNLQDPCGLAISYLDKNGSQTAVTDEVQVIRVRLISQKDENRFVIESAARIRVKKYEE